MSERGDASRAELETTAPAKNYIRPPDTRAQGRLKAAGEATPRWCAPCLAAKNGEPLGKGGFISRQKRLREIDRRVRFLIKRWKRARWWIAGRAAKGGSLAQRYVRTRPYHSGRIERDGYRESPRS